MTLDDFCIRLASLSLSHAEMALAVLWFHDEQQQDISLSSGELSAIMTRMGLGVPHSTRLGTALKKTGQVMESRNGFRLKVIARAKIRSQLESVLTPMKPNVEQDIGYIPKAVWDNTRGYIESVCAQINAAYQFDIYDGAAVLLRRTVETLIIEAYEALSRKAEIQTPDGNYMMLRDLAVRARSSTGLGLGRNAKDALDHIKEAGDQAAHNRRYLTRKADLDRIQSGARTLVEELLVISGLRR